MCGILTIINKTENLTQEIGRLKRATDIIGHRGPDDEGFLRWHSSTGATLYAGEQTSSASKNDYSLETLPEKSNWQVAMRHKRLSIIDLSAAGHQPMMDKTSGISICYNGEIYNYKELKHELRALRHQLNEAFGRYFFNLWVDNRKAFKSTATECLILCKELYPDLKLKGGKLLNLLNSIFNSEGTIIIKHFIDNHLRNRN
jgi:asparagine synthetase B (glutamine-hydrolysing)